MAKHKKKPRKPRTASEKQMEKLLKEAGVYLGAVKQSEQK